jgi:hypothetical protein
VELGYEAEKSMTDVVGVDEVGTGMMHSWQHAVEADAALPPPV